jgi:hypothetical protein
MLLDKIQYNMTFQQFYRLHRVLNDVKVILLQYFLRFRRMQVINKSIKSPD